MYKYTLYFKKDDNGKVSDGYVSAITSEDITYTTKRAECLVCNTEEQCRELLVKARKINKNIHIKFMVFRFVPQGA